MQGTGEFPATGTAQPKLHHPPHIHSEAVAVGDVSHGLAALKHEVLPLRVSAGKRCAEYDVKVGIGQDSACTGAQAQALDCTAAERDNRQ